MKTIVARILLAAVFCGSAGDATAAYIIRNDATGGDCVAIGNWDASTKTCTMTMDLSISTAAGGFALGIDDDGVTLDGNGHTLTVMTVGTGVSSALKNNVTVRNLSINSIEPAAISVAGGYVRDPVTGGYVLKRASGVVISNNIVRNRYCGGIKFTYAADGRIEGNDVVGGASGEPQNCAAIVVSRSSRVTISGNDTHASASGILIVNSSTECAVSGNASHNNNYGIHFWIGSNDNVIENNSITGNVYGYISHLSGRNTVRNNVIALNASFGSYISGTDAACAGNILFRNSFIDNPIQAFEVCEGTAYDLDPPQGGNYWSNYDTPEEGCFDDDKDGFCDTPYHEQRQLDTPYGPVFSSLYDYRPWAKDGGWNKPADTTPPVTGIALSGTEGGNGWFRSGVLVTLTAADEEGGSGVSRTEYGFNWSGWMTYGEPVLVADEGITTLFYRSVDNAGNVEQAKTAQVRIDTTPPNLSVTVDPRLLWPPDHRMVTVTPHISVTDANPGSSVQLISVASSEPDDGPGDGGTAGDIAVDDDGAISLRAERSGKGSGRVYTLIYEAVDGAGNVSSASATVTVPHSMR